MRDIEINRYVAMHRSGPPGPDLLTEANGERHFERVMEFYMDHASRGRRVPSSFGQELALAELFGYCGLFAEVAFGSGTPCLGEVSETPRRGSARDGRPSSR